MSNHEVTRIRPIGGTQAVRALCVTCLRGVVQVDGKWQHARRTKWVAP